MLEVNGKAELDKLISQYKRVIALFSSSWCPFCQKFTKIFDTHINHCNVNLIVRVNMDDSNGPLWDEYKIDAVPTLILFENNAIKSRLDPESHVGITENQFTDWISTINNHT
jgi:thioredoxin-like negative regulator of GroEL